MTASLKFTAAALLFLAAALALAQFRTIPNNAERGTLRHVQGNVVTMNGKSMRLAPGATIRNTENLIIVPTALPAGGALAEYVLDKEGMIFQVWLLTPAEASRQKKR
jgi:hypothetical protein